MYIVHCNTLMLLVIILDIYYVCNVIWFDSHICYTASLTKVCLGHSAYSKIWWNDFFLTGIMRSVIFWCLCCQMNQSLKSTWNGLTYSNLKIFFRYKGTNTIITYLTENKGPLQSWFFLNFEKIKLCKCVRLIPSHPLDIQDLVQVILRSSNRQPQSICFIISKINK